MANEDFMKKEYNLKANPFYDVGYGPRLVNRKDVKDSIYGKIKGFLNVESPQMLFVTGAYGLGKTFTLLEIKREIGENKALKEENVLCCYIRMIPTKAPSDYLLYVYQEIIKGLGLDNITKVLNLAQKIGKDEQKKNNLVADISGNYESIFYLTMDKSNREVYDYILDEIESGDIAKLYLMDLLKLMRIVGFKALIVIIDEFENIFTLSGKRKTAEILTTFREIYDEVNKQIYEKVKIANTITIFASASSTQEDVRELLQDTPGLQAFVDRVRADYIPLPPFVRKYVRELIQVKLEKYKDKPTEKEIFPFKEDFVDYILQVTGGNPRYILQYTATIIDGASDKGYKTIGQKEAQEIVSEKNLG